MADRIEWYLVELERMLKGRISDESLTELQTETKAHLEAESQSNVKESQAPEARLREAVRNFGPPDRLAMQYLQEAGRAVSPWPFRCALAIAAVIYAYPLMLFWTGIWWGLFDDGPLHISTWLWITIAMTLVFAYAVARAKRRLILPLVGVTVACYVPLVLVSARAFVWVEREIGDTMPMPWNEAESAATNQRAMMLANAENTAKLKRGLKAFVAAKAESDVPAEFRRGEAFLTPDAFGPAPNPNAIQSVYFYGDREAGSAGSFESDRAVWAREGAMTVDRIRWADSWDQSIVVSLARAKAGFDWVALRESARVWGVWGVFCAAALMLVNGLVNGIAATSLRSRLHRRRLA